MNKVMFMILILLLLSTRSFAMDIHRLSVGVGSSRNIELKDQTALEVSRKGVVDLVPVDTGKWLVTGLRKGFVLITQRDDRSRVVQRIHVTVNDHVELGSSALENECRKWGNDCSRGQAYLEGKTESFDDWLRAMLLCKNSKQCEFNLTIDGEGLNRLTARLAREKDADENLYYHSGHRLESRRACLDGKRVKKERSAFLALFKIDDLCLDDLQTMYSLRAIIVLLSVDEAKEFGFDSAGTVSSIPNGISRFEGVLRDKELRRLSSVLAQPLIQLRSGQSAKMTSGGEFKVMYDDHNARAGTREGWKPYGMEIELRIHQVRDGALQVATELNLSSPQGTGSESLQKHRIASDLIVDLDKEALVGVTDLYSHVEAVMGRVSLSNIPILGPLFRVKNASEGRRFLVYTLLATKLSDKDGAP